MGSRVGSIEMVVSCTVSTELSSPPPLFVYYFIDIPDQEKVNVGTATLAIPATTADRV